jgi:hypothetical protein
MKHIKLKFLFVKGEFAVVPIGIFPDLTSDNGV